MDNYDLYLQQKRERKKEPFKRRETLKDEIPQTDLKPSSKSIKRSWPSNRSLKGGTSKYNKLQVSKSITNNYIDKLSLICSAEIRWIVLNFIYSMINKDAH